MPKNKSHSGASKRFKVTGSGKVLRERAGKRHLLEHKSSRVTRRLTGNADTFESVDSLKQKFAETGFFSEVEVKDATAAREGGVNFRMIMVLNKDFRPPATR